MKERLRSGALPFLSILLFQAISFIAFAQEKQVDISTKTTTTATTNETLIQPWMYVLGGAIFILLLVALLRGSGKKSS